MQVGYHRFTALWLGYRDGLRPQTKDSIRSMFCKGGDGEGKGVPATCKDLQKERNDLKVGRLRPGVWRFLCLCSWCGCTWCARAEGGERPVRAFYGGERESRAGPFPD